MSTAELPRPGVEVIQVFRTTSPTVVTPTLAPVVVGPCRQVVDAVTSGVLNSQSLLTLPAFFLSKAGTGSPIKYSGLDGLNLVVSVNHGPNVTTTFSDAGAVGLTPAEVVSQVNAALTTAGVTSGVAEVVGTDSWRLRTLTVGDSAHLKVVSGSGGVLTAFGLFAGAEFFGFSTYGEWGFSVPSKNLPDPRGNLAKLTIDASSVRVFFSLGGSSGTREASRTSAYLRRAGTPTTASLTGTANLSGYTAGPLNGLTLVVKIDGTTYTTTFGTPANFAAIVSEINVAAGVTIASQSGNFLKFTSLTSGQASTVVIVSGTGSSLTTLGFTAAQSATGHNVLEAVDDGNGDMQTYVVAAYDAAGAVDFTAASPVPSVCVVTASTVPTIGSLSNKTLILSDGRAPKTVTFGTVSAIGDLVTAINAAFDQTDGITASDDGSGKLRLTSTRKHLDGTTTRKGADSTIVILGGTAVTPSNYLDTAGTPVMTVQRYEGTPYAVQVGDELVVDGTLLGTITQVAPGGVANYLKVDTAVGLTWSATMGYYIRAMGLAAVVTRPVPELVVSAAADSTLSNTILRDALGVPAETTITSGGSTVLLPSRASTYMSYKALRLDVTSKATRPALLVFNSTTELESAVSPITVDNPMALGTYFALLNAPGSQVFALGVDETSADKPQGTVEGYARAFEFLEGMEVYGVAPMTNDADVGSVLLAHVTAMSEPENKGERIGLFNGKTPTKQVDDILASGTAGNGTADTTKFDTGVANLAELLLAAGINPTGTIGASNGVFLDIATDTKSYSVKSVAGSVVTVRTSSGEFGVGENSDAFYATAALPSGLVNEPFAVKVRGASLTNADGTPDRANMALTLQKMGQGYGHRRFWHVIPDTCKATLSGVEQEIAGYYLCAAIAGMVAQQPPQQSFTNFPMTPFTGVVGSNDFFTAKQLNQIAAGGNWIVVQDGANTPLFSRFAITTDLTSVETRTDSVTKVVDYTAKFLRTGLQTFIGRYNITAGFLDTLSSVLQGLGTFLVDTGILNGFKLNNIIQDADAPDTVLIDVTLDVPFPCNFIRLTLVI